MKKPGKKIKIPVKSLLAISDAKPKGKKAKQSPPMKPKSKPILSMDFSPPKVDKKMKPKIPSGAAVVKEEKTPKPTPVESKQVQSKKVEFTPNVCPPAPKKAKLKTQSEVAQQIHSQIDAEYARARDTNHLKEEREKHIRSYRKFVRNENNRFTLSAFFGEETWRNLKKILDAWCASPETVPRNFGTDLNSNKHDFVRVLSSSYVNDAFITDYCALKQTCANAKKKVRIMPAWAFQGLLAGNYQAFQ